MPDGMNTPHVEKRNGGYYVAETQVSLASVIHAFRQGASPETILQDFPYLGSLSKVYGAITLVLENPTIIDQYLKEQDELWEKLEQQHPLPPGMLERFEKAREDLERNSA